jgi:hypothetical protein
MDWNTTEVRVHATFIYGERRRVFCHFNTVNWILRLISRWAGVHRDLTRMGSKQYYSHQRDVSDQESNNGRSDIAHVRLRRATEGEKGIFWGSPGELITGYRVNGIIPIRGMYFIRKTTMEYAVVSTFVYGGSRRIFHCLSVLKLNFRLSRTG